MSITIFDLDGVLSRRDTMATLVLEAVRRRPIRALRILIIALMNTRTRVDGTLRPRLNRRIVRIALHGVTDGTYSHLVSRTIEKLSQRGDNLPEVVRAAFHSAQAAGAVFVVTATEERLAYAYLAAAGLSPTALLASHLRLMGAAPTWIRHCEGDAKVNALNNADVDMRRASFWTDSASDLPLARATSTTVLVDPSAASWKLFNRSTVQIISVTIAKIRGADSR